MRKTLLILFALMLTMTLAIPVSAANKTCEIKYYYTSSDNPIDVPQPQTVTANGDQWYITPAKVFPNKVTKRNGDVIKVYTFDGWYASESCSGTRYSPRKQTNGLNPKYINGKYLLGLYGKWKVETKSAQPQTITTASNVYKKQYTDMSFNLGAKAKTSLSYGSDNVNVCIVDSRGEVKIRGTGTANITITAKADGTYKAANKTVRVEISKSKPTIIVANNQQVAVGNSFSLNAKTNSKGKLTYKSNNTSVVSVSENGVVTALKVGKTTVVVTSQGTDKFLASTKTVNISVTKKTPKITVSPSYAANVGKAFSLNATTTGGKLSYKSSNTSVAKVNSSGTVAPLKVGTVQITVTSAETDMFVSQSKKVNVKITVSQATPVSVIYNANGGCGSMAPQKTQKGQTVTLKPNGFTRAGYTFVGWAMESGKPVMTGTDVTQFRNVNMKYFQLGTVSYGNCAKMKVNGNTNLYAVWKGTGAQAAADWARLIAADNNFHYGKHYPGWANHNGCYYCGTNQNPKGKKAKAGASYAQREKSYCCNYFVTACFVHGNGTLKKRNGCFHQGIGLWANRNKERIAPKRFHKIKKPALGNLKPGDILFIGGQHVGIYVGNGQYAHATGGDDGKKFSKKWNNSIRLSNATKKFYKNSVKAVYRLK